MKIEFFSRVTISYKNDMGYTYVFVGEGETERKAFADALTQLPPELWQEALKEYQTMKGNEMELTNYEHLITTEYIGSDNNIHTIVVPEGYRLTPVQKCEKCQNYVMSGIVMGYPSRFDEVFICDECAAKMFDPILDVELVKNTKG